MLNYWIWEDISKRIHVTWSMLEYSVSYGLQCILLQHISAIYLIREHRRYSVFLAASLLSQFIHETEVTLVQVYSVNFTKFLKTAHLKEHLWWLLIMKIYWLDKILFCTFHTISNISGISNIVQNIFLKSFNQNYTFLESSSQNMKLLL